MPTPGRKFDPKLAAFSGVALLAFAAAGAIAWSTFSAPPPMSAAGMHRQDNDLMASALAVHEQGTAGKLASPPVATATASAEGPRPSAPRPAAPSAMAAPVTVPSVTAPRPRPQPVLPAVALQPPVPHSSPAAVMPPSPAATIQATRPPDPDTGQLRELVDEATHSVRSVAENFSGRADKTSHLIERVAEEIGPQRQR